MPCPPNKIINPKSGRCVLKSGRIGQALCNRKRVSRKRVSRKRVSRKRVSRKRVSIRKGSVQHVRRDMSYFLYDKHPEHIQQFLQDDYTKLHDLYCQVVKRYGTDLFLSFNRMEFIDYYGSGGYGQVYKIAIWHRQFREPDIRAVKIQENQYNTDQEFKDRLENEYEIQNKLAKVGVSPHMDALYFFRNRNGTLCSILVMEALDNSQCEFNVGEALKKPLNADQLFIISYLVWSILDIFCDQNIIHGDLHWNNFYIDLRPNNEWNMDAHLSIIDFSWATIGPCRRELELLQLMRSLMFPHYDPTNREILTFYLVELFNHYTGRKETLSAQEIVCMYKSELDKYIRSK